MKKILFLERQIRPNKGIKNNPFCMCIKMQEDVSRFIPVNVQTDEGDFWKVPVHALCISLIWNYDGIFFLYP
jgi:hypothetical protein